MLLVTNTLINNVVNDYLEYASNDPSTDYINLPDAFSEFLVSSEGRNIINSFLSDIITNSTDDLISYEDITSIITSIMSGYADYAIENGYNDPSRFNEYLASYLSTTTARNLINQELSKLTNKIINNISVDQNDVKNLAKSLEEGYLEYAKKNNKPDPSKLKDSFLEYLSKKDTREMISDGVFDAVNVDDIKSQILTHEKESNKSLTKQLERVLGHVTNDIANSLQSIMIKTMTSLPKALSVDTKKFGSAFKMNLSEEEIKSFINAMVNNSESSYDNNMKYFGYQEEDNVFEITVVVNSKENLVKFMTDLRQMKNIIDVERLIK